MKAYLDIVKDVLAYGQWKENRTGIRTKALPNMHFTHNFGGADGTLYNDYPLLTTKKVAFKTMCVELEGFINGVTDKKWYQERGCKIWNEWANPQAVQERMETELRNNGVIYEPSSIVQQEHLRRQTKESDLGPIYGYQWRKFGEQYGNRSGGSNGLSCGFDQLKCIVDTLKENPNDRRLVCSAWNPNQLHLQALPPCHLLFVITTIGDTINLHWTQRSCDLMLGVPFNIASYGLLLCLLAAGSGLKPGNLSGMLCDCHIYENQLAVADEQIGRTPRRLPEVVIVESDIFKWTHKDVHLGKYNHYDTLDFGPVAI